MINKEKFEEIEMKHGCGYWNVCEDHACSCSPSAAVSQGYNQEVYASMQRQQEKDY